MSGALQLLRPARHSLARPQFPWLDLLIETFQSAPDAPEEPAARLKDPWPGHAARGERLVRDEAALMAALDPEPNANDPELARDVTRRARAHSFAWLRDLRSLGGDNARRAARRGVAAWIEVQRRSDAICWRPDIVGQRLSAWMGAYEFYAASAGPGFRADLMEQTAVQTAWLRRRIDQAPAGAGRLAALAGLAAGAAAIGQLEPNFSVVERQLERLLRRELTPDGGLVGATPLAQLDALMRLLDLRAAFAAVDRPPPEASTDAASAMAAPLAALRFGDGGLAVFGGGEGDPWTVDLALAASSWRGRAPKDLPQAGYARALAGRAALVASATGGFEFANGADRIVVSTGGDSDAPPSRFAAPEIAHVSGPAFPGARAGAAHPIHRDHSEGASLLTLDWSWSHPDVDWRRRLYLAADGLDLRGGDEARGPAGEPTTVSFHLHPSADAIQLDDGGVLIRAHSGEGWRFRADRPSRLASEPYRGRPGPAAAALRIEVPVRFDANGVLDLRWAFRVERA